MKTATLILLIFLPAILPAQNVGIGTLIPAEKLDVNGNINVSGTVKINGVDGTPNQVLVKNGSGVLTWGTVNGTVPAGTIVATENYNDAALLSKGFTLYGMLPGYSKFFNSSFTAGAGSWAVTYYRGNLSKFSPPVFDGNNLAVWADTVLYVFSHNQLYAYNPVGDTWRFVLLNPTSFAASAQCKAAWTGTEILVWGGYYNSATNNGFRYNPGTNVWTAIPGTNQPSARYGFAMDLVNDRLVVWGGTTVSGNSLVNDGAVLDLATNTWTATSNTGAPSGRSGFTSVVNISQNTIMIWGGRNASIENTGAMYDLLANTWSAITTTGAPVARDYHTAVWSGTEMIVFGGRDVSGNAYNSGGRYNPVTNTWTATSTAGVLAKALLSSIWTDSRMLVSGGSPGNGNGPDYGSYAFSYDPVTNSWSYANDMGVSKGLHLLIRAGNIIIAFGGYTPVYNAAAGTYVNEIGYPQGSRYFLASTVTSKTEILSRADLYLYIKL